MTLRQCNKEGKKKGLLTGKRQNAYFSARWELRTVDVEIKSVQKVNIR